MAAPAVMAGVGIGSSVLGGLLGAKGAETTAAGKQIDIQGQMLKTVGQVFGLETQAQQYGAQAQVSDYQAAVAKMNKDLAENQANYERDKGEATASARGMQEHADVSKAVAIQSASGLDIKGGSAQRVTSSIVALGQLDQATIRANAARVAYGFEVQATQEDAQSQLYTFQAGQDRVQQANTLSAVGLAEQAIPLEQQASSLVASAGDTAAAASLVSAAGSVASKWTEASKVFGS